MTKFPEMLKSGSLHPNLEQGEDTGQKTIDGTATIGDMISDPRMPVEERQEQPEALAGGVEDASGTGGDIPFDPLAIQIDEALTFLAEGGHAYGTIDETQTIVRSDPPTDSASEKADARDR